MPLPAKRSYQFGPFCLNASEQILLRDGVAVPLMPKTIEILMVLVRHSGQVVRKEDLISEVWPDVIVEESNLTKQISTLRRALGDEEGGNKYIETLPKRGYRFVAPIKAESQQTALVTAERHSIAVLPFKLMGFEEGEAYFGLGITDCLITKLIRVKTVVVRPLNAVLKYNSLSTDVYESGRELGVKFVLDGHLQKVGDRVRATLHLIKTDTGATLWAATLDEELMNIFALQDVISEKVTEALLLKLTPQERQLLAKRHTENLQAYNNYLMGRYHWNFFSTESLKLALKHFEHALEYDPDFALAYAGITEYCLAVSWMGNVSAHKVMPKGKAAALKALALDDHLAQAHTALGLAKLVYDFDWDGAEASFLRAIELNLGDEIGFYWYALLMVGQKRFDEARVIYARGNEINHLSPLLISLEGLIDYYARRFDSSLESLQKLREMIPHYIASLLIPGLCYIAQGKYEQAIEILNQGIPASGRAAALISALAYAYAKAGDEVNARALLNELKDEKRAGYVQPSYVSLVHANLGETEEAIEYLQKAYDERHGFLIFLNVEPAFDPLRSDPRFIEIVKRIGLTP